MKTTALLILSLCALMAASEAGETIVTSTGTTFPDATVFNLTKTYVEIRYDFVKKAFIPLRHLPPEIRARYRQAPEGLNKVMKDGINGEYAPRGSEDGLALAGEIITLKDGTFTQSVFSDAGGARGPISGKFTVSGEWITFHHPKFQFPTRVLVAVDGRLTIMRGYDFVSWKDGEGLGLSNALYRKMQ